MSDLNLSDGYGAVLKASGDSDGIELRAEDTDAGTLVDLELNHKNMSLLYNWLGEKLGKEPPEASRSDVPVLGRIELVIRP